MIWKKMMAQYQRDKANFEAGRYGTGVECPSYPMHPAVFCVMVAIAVAGAAAMLVFW